MGYSSASIPRYIIFWEVSSTKEDLPKKYKSPFVLKTSQKGVSSPQMVMDRCT